MNLERLRELESKATKGPWIGDRHDGSVKYAIYGHDMATVLECDHKNGESGFLGDKDEFDEQLVIESRNALPELLDWIERAAFLLKGDKARSEATYGNGVPVYDAFEIDEAKDLLAELKDGHE